MDAKKHSLLLLMALWLSVTGLAQEQLPTLVFQLTAEQAEQVYRGNFDEIQPENIGLPVDSFYQPRDEQPRAVGHYLYVTPELENVRLQVESYHSFQVSQRNNDRDLALEIIDQHGQKPLDAVVHLNRKRVPYDPITQTYRLQHRLKGGFLRIAVGNEVVFFNLTEA